MSYMVRESRDRSDTLKRWVNKAVEDRLNKV